MTLDTWVSGEVEKDGWAEFFAVAIDSEATLEFEVVAKSGKPAAIGVYVDDADGQHVTVDANSGEAVLATKLHGATPSENAAVISADTVSRIGNATHRHYYAYVSPCYAIKGRYFFLSVFGATYGNVTFQAIARSIPASLSLGATKGKVCDDKYMHHFYDLPTLPTHGGLEFKVQRTSGETTDWYLQYEKCAGPGGTNLFKSNLFGHGLIGSSTTLPSTQTDLQAGRYYISVRGAADMCGEYEVTVTEITDDAAAAAANE